MSRLTTEATLRRGVFARARTIRFYEIAAWAAIVVFVVRASDGFALDNDSVLVVSFGAIGVAIRAAIASERVRCDASGVAWRSTFVTFRVGWDEITSMEIAARPMRSWLFRGGTVVVALCLRIERGTQQRPLFVTPAMWVSMTRQAEFIAAARLISPADWTLSAGR